jgi:hypothetical protein
MNKQNLISVVLTLLIVQTTSAQYKGGNGEGHGMASAGTSANTLPLPIKLVSFTANQHDTVVILNWSTVSEENNDVFVLEKSIEGFDFEKIGSVKGAGNSSQQLDYVFYDKNPVQGKSYYRLKQIDFDGQFTYSDVQKVVNNKIMSVITGVFPNPFNEQITIESPDLESFRIYNAEGKDFTFLSVKLVQSSTSIVLNTSQLPAGIYWIRVGFVTQKMYKLQ